MPIPGPKIAGPWRIPAVLLCAVVVLLGCSPTGEGAPSEPVEEADPRPVASAEDPLSGLETSSWVKIFDPAKAWPGYTLALHRRTTPILMDLNGRIVHAWPAARVRSRVRLLEDGSLLGIARNRAIVEFDWDGNLTWEHRLEGRIPHHDLIRLANGNTLVVTRPSGGWEDILVEIDRGHRVVWEWRSHDHLRPFYPEEVDRGDVSHINSVQELPPSPWCCTGGTADGPGDGQDGRFRPGNLLVSARNLNLVFILDRRTGEVVWSFGERLDFQHEALMIRPGSEHHGRILVLSNGWRGKYAYRQSAVLEIDPIAKSIVWEYLSDDFHTPTGGVEQPLPNGNVLITSSRGGRTFEVTRGGEIVWQWVPPFAPTRTARVPYDHCPQLAALERRVDVAVRPDAGYRHVDGPVYRFSNRGTRRSLKVDGKKTDVLADNRECTEMVLPAGARIELAYGLDRKQIRAAGRKTYAARFGLRLLAAGSGEDRDLFEDTLGFARGGGGGREAGRRSLRGHREIGLEAFAFQRVRICLETEELGAPERPTEDFAWWADPLISTAAERAAAERAAVEAAEEELSGEEAEVQREHLEALGYVD